MPESAVFRGESADFAPSAPSARKSGVPTTALAVALTVAPVAGPTSPLDPEPLDIPPGEWDRLRFRAADAADRTRQLALTRLQAEGAELLVAAALDGLVARDAEGHPRWAAGAEHGLACPPSLAGFAAVHARVGRRELGALQRLLLSERTQPAIRAALRRQVLTPGAARELRRIATDDAQVEAWIAWAETAGRDAVGRRLGMALAGDRPDDVDPIRAAQAVLIRTPTAPDAAGAEASVTLRVQQGLAPLDYYWWARAAQRAAIREQAGVLPTRRALEAMVATLAAEVAAEREPRSGADRPLRGEYHCDPIRQVAWVQVPGQRLQIPMDAVPAPGPDVAVEVLSADRARVPHTAAAVLAAFPELADDPLPPPAADPAEHRRWLATGLVTYGVQPPTAFAGSDGVGEADTPAAPEPGASEPGASGERDDPLNTLAAAQAALARIGDGPVPDVSALTPDEQRALLAAAARVWREAECHELEQADEARTDAQDGTLELWDVLDALGYQEGERWAADRIRLAGRLRERPALRAAFVSGAVSYTHARVVASRPARLEAQWTALARVVDADTLRVWTRATPRDAAPPPVPAGEAPLRPIAPVAVQIRGRLHGDAAEAFQLVLGALEAAAGRPLAPAEWLPQLARWYLRVTEGGGRATIIYQRSPATRGADRPRTLLAEALWHVGPAPGRPYQRLRAAFRALPDLGDPAADARAACRRDRRAHRAPAPGERRVPPVVRDVVRWTDGEHCIVPGCSNLRAQHDHGAPVAGGGAASRRLDHRLCGPCNRARAAGRLRLEFGPFGTVRFFDPWGRQLGRPRLLYAQWDGPVRTWLANWARREWEASPEFFSQFWRLVYAQSPALAAAEFAAAEAAAAADAQEPSAAAVPNPAADGIGGPAATGPPKEGQWAAG